MSNDSLQITGNVLFPLRNAKCPACDTLQGVNDDDYLIQVQCSHCGVAFRYLDGYLKLFENRAQQFINANLSIPLVPGCTMGNELWVEPNEIYQIYFDPAYARVPEVLFLTGNGSAVPDLLRENLYTTAISVKPTEFLILTRVFDRTQPTAGMWIRWIALGEMTIAGEKPLWLIYLENAVDLIRKEEERAAVVILLIALDFFYDEQLSILGVTYQDIRSRGRRPGMNEKKAKLEMLQELLGEFSAAILDRLRDVTDFRNRIVHPVVRRSEVLEIPASEAFITVIDTIQIILKKRYLLIQQGNRSNTAG